MICFCRTTGAWKHGRLWVPSTRKFGALYRKDTLLPLMRRNRFDVSIVFGYQIICRLGRRCPNSMFAPAQSMHANKTVKEYHQQTVHRVMCQNRHSNSTPCHTRRFSSDKTALNNQRRSAHSCRRPPVTENMSPGEDAPKIWPIILHMFLF